MKKKVQRVVVILIVAALLLAALLPVLSIFAQASVTQNDIENIRDELNEVSERKKEVETQLVDIRNDLAQARQAVELVQEQVLLTEQQISYSQSILDEYDVQIGQKEADLLELEAQEAEQLQEFYDQVRWMEETGSVSYLSILFQASSFSEMLDYAMLLADIMDYSDRIIRRLEAVQAEIKQAREELQADRDAQAAVQAQLEAQKVDLENRRAEATDLMNSIAASESEYAQQAANLAAEEAEIQRNLSHAEQQYAAQLASLNNTGEWYWPLPGRYGLSSRFGGRYLFGKWESHTGTDIPAPAGTEIHSAQGGVVTFVSSNQYSSYGWYCMVSHGNGHVTLYAHMRTQPIVTVGQTVSKGQILGYVGTTGNSTGNHLHFELRVNGMRNDVLKLYPNLTFTYNGRSFQGAG